MWEYDEPQYGPPSGVVGLGLPGAPAAVILPNAFAGNMLGGKAPTVTSGTTLVTDGSICRRVTNTADRWWVNVSGHETAISPFWIFARFKPVSTSASRVFIRLGDNAAGTPYLELSPNVGGNNGLSVVTGGTPRIVSSGGLMVTAQFCNAVASYDGTTLALFLNGISYGTLAIALTGTRDTFGFGGDGTTVLSCAATHAMAGLVNGVMPPGWAREFQNSPWGAVLAPHSSILVAGLAAPALCLVSGVLVNKPFVSTDRKVYLTTAGALVAKTESAGAGEKLVKMVNGRLQAG